MKEWAEAFTIFAKYTDNNFDIGAEHEQIWVYVTHEDLPVTSDDGKRLLELGWWVQGYDHEDPISENNYPDDGESWSKFV